MHFGWLSKKYFQLCGIWEDFDFAVRYMAVSYMVTLCVIWFTVRYMVATVRYMVHCALYVYCAVYGLYNCETTSLRR